MPEQGDVQQVVLLAEVQHVICHGRVVRRLRVRRRAMVSKVLWIR